MPCLAQHIHSARFASVEKIPSLSGLVYANPSSTEMTKILHAHDVFKKGTWPCQRYVLSRELYKQSKDCFPFSITQSLTLDWRAG